MIRHDPAMQSDSRILEKIVQVTLVVFPRFAISFKHPDVSRTQPLGDKKAVPSGVRPG